MGVSPDVSHDEGTENERCLILYGSETGTAEEVAFKLHRTFAQCSLNCAISSLDDYEISKLPSETCIIWIIATSGEGEVPPNMKTFWKFLLRKNLSSDSLKGVTTAVFGLGDSSYEKFNAAARRLNKRLGQLGSTELIPIGLGDDQSKFGYFTELDSWVAKLLPALKRRRKSAEITSSMENATSMILKAHYLVTLLPLTTPDASLQSNQLYKQSKYVYDELNVLQSCFTPPENHKNHSSQSLCEDGKCLPIVGYVKENHRMTHDSWSQDVRHVVISASLSSIDTCVNSSDVTSGTEIFTTTPSDSLAATVDAALLLRTSYDKLSPGRSSFGRSQVPMAEPSHIAGDVATVYPINDPLLVTRIISILNRSNHEGSVTTVNDREFLTSTMISVKCLSGFVKRKSRINELKRCSIGRLFSSFIDIAGIPQRGFFEGLALHTGNIDEKEKLLEIASAEGTDLYYDYCLKEKRNYIEVLEDFRTANPSLSQLLEMIPVLQPRHYSIANSGLVERGEIHLCVAIASAKTPYGRERTGICSGYLSSLVQGDQVLLWVRSGALKLPLLPSYLFKSEALDNSFTSISNDASHVVSVQSAEGLEKRIDIISHDDAHIPKMILIGPGTGIAPMRALIRERKVAYQRIHQMNLKANIYTQVSSVKTLLFFGCRNREKDFLYSEEWKGLKSSLSSRKTDVAVKDISAQDPDMFEGSSESVVVAFSRDQTKKVYVTDKIKLYGHLVWSLIEEDAYIFISGSAKRMPSDVKVALKSVIISHGKKTEEEASALLLLMEKKGRYVVEAWS